MRLNHLAGLLALVLTLSLPYQAPAQGLANPLPTEDVDVSILGASTVAAGGSVTSEEIIDPYELKSLEYDSTSTANVGGLSIVITYSAASGGPFVAGVDSNSSGFTNTWTINTTPTSGANVMPFPLKYAKVQFKNDGSVAIPLKRVTALRRRISGSLRPVALTDRTFDFSGLAAAVVANAGTSSQAPSDALLSADEFQSFWLDGTGSAGTKKIQMRYSNAAAGPFSTWEDQGSAGNQNEVSVSPVDTCVNVRPFPALYMKVQLLNSSGASYTIGKLQATRREQRKR